MFQRLILSKVFIKYILIFNLIKFNISSDINFIYINCKKYIDKLDIKCFKFQENKKGILECTKWDISNILAFTDIPNECLNKEYNLDILAQNKNQSIKINSNIYIGKETLIHLKKKEVKLILKKIGDIHTCLDIFTEYLKICISKKSNNKIKNECKEWRKKQDKKEFKFCIFLLENFKHFIEPKSKNKKIRKNITLDDITFIFKEKINNTLFNLSEKIIDEKYDINFIIEKIDNDNDIEKLKNNSIKDCIEYGLNPSNEDLIICTKYE